MDRVAVGRVFIVDDNAPFRTVARALLESGGYQVVGDAATGAEALARVPATGPDVVLLDVALPDMDGFSVCRALRDASPGVTVVLCSVRDAEQYGDAVERCAAAGFLPKSALAADTLALLVARQDERR
ncbi:Response regulator receiver protein [Frankia canadensis]|uniref:Response regulator receiver protein n=1 Tax=Frankia canadensis TaxID=1836972 RepID=A0A2I2KV63_9ACTN|nr:response regulator transcription factor [Frankia canadensis]SNQ49540.1 Response regulator receiver protein [Frankia canadensis]SOU56830.1 Response regulator receiver protein [Frankia canadensis]